MDRSVHITLKLNARFLEKIHKTIGFFPDFFPSLFLCMLLFITQHTKDVLCFRSL